MAFGGGPSFEDLMSYMIMEQRGYLPSREHLNAAQEEVCGQIYGTAEQLKMDGNAELAKNRLPQALSLYSKALEYAMRVPANETQISVILSNRSAVFSKMKRVDEALRDAGDCIKLNPSWHRGYYRSAQIFRGINKHPIALTVLSGGLRNCAQEMPNDVRLKFLTDFFRIGSVTSVESVLSVLAYQAPYISAESWSETIKELITKKEWRPALLFINVYEAVSVGEVVFAMGFSAQGLSLSGLCDKSGLARQLSADSVHQMVLVLIKHGAHPDTLSRKLEVNPPLHVALDICLSAGTMRLMEHLLAHHYMTPQSRHLVDSDKNTLYHVICSNKEIKTSVTREAIRVLLNFGIGGANILKNKDNKTALDFLSAKDPVRKMFIPDTIKGKVDNLKDLGNDLQKRKKSTQAIEKYTEAIGILRKMNDDSLRREGLLRRDLAVLYSNRCASYVSNGAVELALKDAVKCTNVDEMWFRGHVRIGNLSKRQGDLYTAMQAYSAAFELLKKDNDDQSWQKDVFFEIAVLTQEIRVAEGRSSFTVPELPGMRPSTAVVTAVMERLAKSTLEHKWETMYILCTAELTKDCNLQKVKFGEIFRREIDDLLADNWHKYQESLVIELLELKAPVEEINFDTYEADTPLHTATIMACLSGRLHLLEYILKRQLVPLDKPSSEGLPVLHFLAKQFQDTKFDQLIRHVVDTLLYYGCDPRGRDRFGHLPIELIRNPADPMYVFLKEAMSKVKDKPSGNGNRPRSTAKSSKPTSSSSSDSGVKKNAAEKHPRGTEKSDKKPSNAASGDNSKKSTNQPKGKQPTPKVDPSVCKCSGIFAEAVAARASGNIHASADKCRNIVQKDGVHRQDEHISPSERAVKMLTDIFDTCKEETPKPFQDLPVDTLQLIVTQLAARQRWTRVVALLNQIHDRVVSENGEVPPLARNIDIGAYIESNNCLGDPRQRIKNLERLLLYGAPPGGLIQGNSAVKKAVQKPDYVCLPTLLKKGGKPVDMVLQEGSTPLHVALQIGLDLDIGNFEVLITLFRMRKESTDLQSDLDLQATDQHGDGLFHLAARVKFTKHSLKAVVVLSEYKVNPNIRNKEGKTAFECLPKRNDRRAGFIKDAGKKFAPPKPMKKEKKVEQQETEAPNETAPGIATVDEVTGAAIQAKPCTAASAGTVSIKKEDLKRALGLMIDELPEYYEAEAEEESEGEAEESDENPDEELQADQALAGCEEGTSGEEEGAALEEPEDSSVYYQVEPSVFDDLDWDVECPAHVWKLLREKVSEDLKRRIVYKIQLLAQGERWNSLVHAWKGVSSDVKLCYTKLGKGRYILWELAIAFSPRRSETPERRLKLDTEVQFAAAGGRVYTEVIRIWDIVLNRHFLIKKVEQILKSHDRGEECLLQKKLRGISRSGMPPTNKRLPQLFTEDDAVPGNALPGATASGDGTAQRFYPPASANETEYHIVKFYNFSSALVTNIMEQENVKVDFPFRVTELEHAIINLQSRTPILLLGRSGTGKTTCCLYRLWDRFVRYWEVGKHGRMLERKPVFIRQNSKEEECQDDEEAEDGLEALISQRRVQTGAVGAELMSDTRDDETCEGATGGVDPQSQEDACCSSGEARVILDHLHQVFITKNAVLCQEVRKNFQEMGHACQAARAYVKAEGVAQPARLQDTHPDGYPLFLTSRSFLLMLDASLPGTPFFERLEDGTMRRTVLGWGDGESLRVLIPNLESVHEDLDDELEELEDEPQPEARRQDPRREVTYEVFAHELWSQINKKAKVDYHASLVWTEIQSFIEGSLEALSSDKGYLQREKYKELGRKRAPNFTGDRDTVYDLFLMYLRLKQNKQLFDEQDFVHHVYKRMSGYQGDEWVLHQIYVDETQDFTQAELCLLIRCCQNPNDMFLTGDTAQSIMRGVSFRFEDLKTLFYEARRSMKALGKTAAVKVPSKVYQLTHNYRSHSGILHLASSVIDLMVQFFPDSFDRLQPDQGLFDGPPPKLLESCNEQDLAMLLSGNIRQASHIEFGAHQAVLVVNDAARESLPEELKFAIVLTIFESKGLEFDDILIYNFFKDSQAKKEWRVVTEFLNELVENQKHQRNKDSLYELDLDILEDTQRPRPLHFDPGQHKILNSELKHLYTAITRARVNVWLFDEDPIVRAPVFEYWKTLGLVRIIQPEVVGGDGEEVQTELPFASQSTKLEWRQQGDKFFRKELYQVAANCYRKSEDTDLENLLMARLKGKEAVKQRQNPRRMREVFVQAAHLYMQCEHLQEAALCLQNAREHQMAGHLWEKLGENKKAARCYVKCGAMADAVKLYEMAGDFRHAVDILVNANSFNAAVDVLMRYQMLNRELKEKGTPAPAELMRPAERHTVENLSYAAANKYYKQYQDERKPGKHAESGQGDEAQPGAGAKSKMVAALDRLPSNQDRINFLLERDFLDEALPLMKKEGQLKDIVKRLREAGRIKDALKYADADTYPELRAGVLVDLARRSVLSLGSELSGTDKETIKKQLNEAIELIKGFKGDNEVYRCGEAMVMRAIIIDDSSNFRETMDYCEKKSLLILEVMLYEHAMQRHIKNCPGISVAKHFVTMTTLVRCVKNHANGIEQKYYSDTLKYFGLEESFTDPAKLIVKCNEGARILELHSVYSHKLGNSQTLLGSSIETDYAQTLIMTCLTEQMKRWHTSKVEALKKDVEGLTQCQVFIESNANCGKPSGMCPNLHARYSRTQFEQLVAPVLSLICFNSAVHTHIEKNEAVSKVLSKDKRFKIDKEGLWCERLFQILFPVPYQPRVATWTVGKAWGIVQWVRSTGLVKEALLSYAEKLWVSMEKKYRHCNFDILFRILQLHLLCKGNTEALSKQLLQCEEDAMNSKPPKRSNYFVVQTSEGQRLFSFFRSLLYFIGHIYREEKPDAFEASKTMMDLLTFSAKKCYVPVVPSFCNAVTLMELQLVLLTGMLLQHKPHCSLLIPTSFVCAVNWYDAMCGKRGVTLNAAVQKYYADNYKFKAVLARLRTLTQLLTGFFRSDNGTAHFNMLEDVFNQQSIDNGEAERVLVMALTILMNCGPSSLIPLELPPMGSDRSIYNPEDMIRITLNNINVEGLKMPARLRETLEAARSAVSTHDVLIALRNLLTDRQDEALYLASWGHVHSSPPRVIYNFLKNKSVVPQRLYFKLDMGRIVLARQQYKQHKPQGAPRQEAPAELGDEPETLELSEVEAAELVQQQTGARGEDQLQQQPAQMQEMQGGMYLPGQTADTNSGPSAVEQGMVNENACMICGVDFVQQTHQERFEEDVEDTDESDQGMTTFNAPRSQEMQQGETYGDHVISQYHKTQAHQFNYFHQMNSQQIQPFMQNIRTVLNLDFVDHLSENSNEVQRIRNDLQQAQGLQISSIWNALIEVDGYMRTIYSNRLWSEVDKVLMGLGSIVQNCDGVVICGRKIAEEIKQTKIQGAEDDVEDDVLEDVIEEPAPRAKHNRGGGGGGGRTAFRKNNGKRSLRQ